MKTEVIWVLAIADGATNNLKDSERLAGYFAGAGRAVTLISSRKLCV